MVPHMAQITLGGNPINTNGDLPAAGAAAPDFTLTKADWTPVSAADLAGQRVVMNIFPSLDTGPCQLTIRTFNERAADLDKLSKAVADGDFELAIELRDQLRQSEAAIGSKRSSVHAVSAEL